MVARNHRMRLYQLQGLIYVQFYTLDLTGIYLFRRRVITQEGRHLIVSSLGMSESCPTKLHCLRNDRSLATWREDTEKQTVRIFASSRREHSKRLGWQVPSCIVSTISGRYDLFTISNLVKQWRIRIVKSVGLPSCVGPCAWLMWGQWCCASYESWKLKAAWFWAWTQFRS